jgi:hypothetical protein
MRGAFALVVLCLPGVLPALALSGFYPATPFLIPLAGATMAAVAAGLEFAVTGSIMDWFIVVAVLVNVSAAIALRANFVNRTRPLALSGAVGSTGASPSAKAAPLSSGWRAICLLVVTAGVAWPLLVLKEPVIGYDTQAIWLIHAAQISGGHHAMVAGFTNPYYRESHPDYPPLIPGAGALIYAVLGQVSHRLAVAVTTVLNASAIGVVATGLLRIVPARSTALVRLAAVLVAFAFCGAGFGIGGTAAVSGYADVLWSAAALGATVYGLVLPRERRHLLLAWLCILVASLTKNEGLAASIVISGLTAIRYMRPGQAPLGSPRRAHRVTGSAVETGMRAWTRLAAAGLAPLVPGVIWPILVREHGLEDSFFLSGSPQSVSTRLTATIAAMSGHLYLVPGALVVLLIGVLTLRYRRADLGLANPAWLWTVAVASLLITAATYVFGTPAIHWWLNHSVGRTTIFAQMTFLSEIVIWSFVLLSAKKSPPSRGSVARHALEAPGGR